MTSTQKLGSGFLWLTTQAVGRQLLLFVLFAILGRLLDPHDFGAVAIASSAVLLLQALSSQAISAAVIQRQDLTDEETATAFTLNLIFAVGLAILVALGCALYVYAYPDEKTLPMVIAIMTAMMPVYALFEIHLALLARDMRFDLIAKKSIIGQVVSSLVAVAMAFAGFGVWSLVAQFCMMVLIEFAVVRYYSSWKASLMFRKAIGVEFMRFGGPLVAARGIVAVDLRSPELLLGGFAGQASTGHFRVARSLFDVIVALVGLPLRQMILPTLAPIKGDQVLLKQRYLMLSAANAWLFFAPLAVFGVWGGEITVVVFSAKWSESAWIAQIFAFQGIAYALFYLYEPLLTAAGRTGDLLRLRAIQATLSIGCMIAAIPFGARAMIIANAGGVLLSMPFMYYFVTTAAGIDFRAFARSHIAPCVAGALVVAILFSIRSGMNETPLLVQMAISTVVAMAVYMAAFLRFGDAELRNAIWAFAGRLTRERAGS